MVQHRTKHQRTAHKTQFPLPDCHSAGSHRHSTGSIAQALLYGKFIAAVVSERSALHFLVSAFPPPLYDAPL